MAKLEVPRRGLRPVDVLPAGAGGWGGEQVVGQRMIDKAFGCAVEVEGAAESLRDDSENEHLGKRSGNREG